MVIIRKNKTIQTKPTEQELAQVIIKWLEKEGWEIYQEVLAFGSVADIVAVKNGLTWIIETKINYGLQVLNQAMNWVRYRMANFVSIATLINSTLKINKYRHVQHYFHHDNGIGLIIVKKEKCFGYCVERNIKPHFYRIEKRQVVHDIRKYLLDEQKTGVNAGTANGGYETTFKKTVRQIESYIRRNPGKTIKEIIEAEGSYHYQNPQSAKQSLSKLLNEKIFTNIRFENENGTIKLFYNNSEPSVNSVAKKESV